MIHAGTAATLALLLGVVGPASAQGVYHFVPGDFATIQEAIDASSDSDVIVVSPGTWAGPLDTQGLDIEIRALSALEGAELTVIDGLGAAAVLRAGVPGENSTASLWGFTLTGGVDGVVTDGGGKIDLGSCIVRDNAGVGGRGAVSASHCTFQGNGSHGLDDFSSATYCTFSGNGGWGVVDLSGFMIPPGVISAPPIDGCSFLGNGLGGARLAVASSATVYPAEIRVTGCLFVGDSLQVAALEAGGIGDTFLRSVTLDGGNVKLMHGTLDVTSCILRSPVPITDLSDTGSPTVTYSDLPGAWSPGTGNIDADPLWTDPEAGDYTLVPGSPCINSGNPAFTDTDFSPAEMGAFTYYPWTNLGGGIGTGPGDTPLLTGSGGLIAGKPILLKVWPPQTGGVWLFASLTELGVPFKGGVLWPVPDLVFGPLLPHFPQDQILNGYWPSGLPAGFSFVVQAWWPDATEVAGWAATNGLRGVQP